MQIVRFTAGLPSEIEGLARTAAVEGILNMELLTREFTTGQNRFDAAGEALFGAYVAGNLAGVGGVGREMVISGAMRMRRFYVSPSHRGASVGRALAGAAIQQGLQVAEMLTVNARASAAAGPFWEALGFTRDERQGWTHVLVSTRLANGRH